MNATQSKFRPVAQAKGAVPKREGDVILLTIPNYWGRGKTFAEAKQKLREAGGRLKDTAWRVYSVHADTEVLNDGSISHPTGHEPVFIDECDPD